jgi:hypothetical protein
VVVVVAVAVAVAVVAVAVVVVVGIITMKLKLQTNMAGFRAVAGRDGVIHFHYFHGLAENNGFRSGYGVSVRSAIQSLAMFAAVSGLLLAAAFLLCH